MLKRLSEKIDIESHACKISNLSYPQLFPAELEFNAPARGMWNIVHTGMLIPQAHQIFICAQGCLRGVILTAAEMNAMDRMSFVTVQENDLFDGSLESNAIEGITAILNKMPDKPPAVLVFFSCVQLFAGCDLQSVLNEVKNRFPQIDFVECLMHPTMRKSGLTPDAFMRQQLYAALPENTPVRSRTLGIIGNDRATDEESELTVQLRKQHIEVRDICYCNNYAEYKALAECEYFLAYYTPAQAALESSSSRLQRKALYISLSYNFEEIERGYQQLTEYLNLDISAFDLDQAQADAQAELELTCRYLNNMPILIDYTATLRNLSLARLLLDHNFNVQGIYTDVVIPEEFEDMEYLQKNYPDLLIYPTLHPAMRFAVKRPGSGDEYLAIGQKAACFCGTRHLVNIVSGGGWFGFEGIKKMCRAMRQAKNTLSDTENLIQLKGWGCESCI